MSRKRVDLAANAKRPEGRQVMWEAMRRLRQFRIKDLEHATRIGEATIRTYIEGLTNAGYLRKLAQPEVKPGGTQGFQPAVWELVRDVGIEAPRVTRDGKEVVQGRGREQMWRTMRIIGGPFDHHSLAVQASTEECPVAVKEAQFYCQYLHRAGYLAEVEPGGPNKPTRYRMLPTRYTGPLAPQIQRIRQVWDPNTQQVVWRPKGGDE